MARRLRSKRVLVLACLAGASLLVAALLIRAPASTRSADDSVPLDSPRRQVAQLSSDAKCSIERGLLQLGEVSSWGSQYGADGRPQLCVVCACRITANDAAHARLSCLIHDCPFFPCPNHSQGGDAEPDHQYHQCCHICGPFLTARTAPAAAAPSPTMDARVPLTGDVYRGVFRHLPDDLCTSGSPLAVVAVTSVPAAAARRTLFRRLYGAAAAAANMRLVFVLGLDEPVPRAVNDFFADDFEHVDGETVGADGKAGGPSTSASSGSRRRAVQRAVNAEAKEFGDLIQSSVPEHYFHLALKTVSLLDAILRVCPRARFLVKTDDDVLINMPLLAGEAAALPAGRVIHGRLAISVRPDRLGMGWYSSEREWPADTYPAFVLGNGYLVSGAALAPLLRAALAARYHHLEDVFVTGVAAEAADLERRGWPRHCLHSDGAPSVCEAARCALMHRVSYDDHADRLETVLHAIRGLDVEACARNWTSVTGQSGSQ